MPNALILLAPGFEETEAVTIIDLLQRAQVEVDVAGLEKQYVTGSHNITVNPDFYYLDVDAITYDILILPGGQPGTNNLKKDETVLEWIKQRHAAKKKLAAICAAPTVLHAAGITKDVRLTSYPAEKEVFTDSHYLEEPVVIDGHIITSRGVGTAIPFALTLISILINRNEAEEIAERILYDGAF